MNTRTPRRFHDRLTHPLHKPRDWLRNMMMTPNRSRHVALEQSARVPRDPGAPRTAAAPGETRVTWVGHATFLIEMEGMAVLTDPVWSRKLIGGIRRATEPGMKFEDLPAIDAIVISHNHYDHLDWPTVRRLPRDTLCLVPLGLGRWFRRRGFTNVVEHDWWQATRVGHIRIEFVPAHHWSRRGLFDTNASLWGGWMLTPRHGGATYFAGDTGYGPCFKEIAERHPHIDIALLPVGAYSPRWYLKHVHADPHEAVRAFGDVGARIMVPMHWGTFRLSHEPIMEPIERTHRAWEAAGHAPATLWDLALGEGRTLPHVRAGAGPRPARVRNQAAMQPGSSLLPANMVTIHRYSQRPSTST